MKTFYLSSCIFFICFALTAQAQTWQNYDFTAVGCKISFPIAPASAQEGNVWTAQAKQDNNIYQIAVHLNKSYTNANSESVLEESITGFVNPATDHIDKQENLTIDGLPAKQIQASSQDGTYIVFRVIVGKNKLYQLAIMGTNPAKTLTNAQKFLDSFKPL
jgi:hypothetical protein